MRMYRILGLALVFGWLALSGDVRAQMSPSEWSTSNGVLHVIDWPNSAQNRKSIDSLRVHAEILPYIDSLSVGYGYRATSEQPFLTFAVEWKAADNVFLDGEEVPTEQLNQEELYIESLRLRTDVIVEGEAVSQVDFLVDSLMLPSYPALFSMEINDLTWDSVFPGVPDSVAKAYFSSGFELANPEIINIAFLYEGEELPLARNSPQVGKRRPSRRSVYGPAVDVIIHIPIIIHRPAGTRIVRGEDRRKTPRDSNVGRGGASTDGDRSSGERSAGTSEEGGESRRTGAGATAGTTDGDDEDAGILSGKSKKKKKDDEDDDDDDELLAAAIVGAAAVAALAVAGGTVGYYGNTKQAPIGLTAGFVRPTGGILLQAAVNDAVLQRSRTEPEYFLGRIVGFYDLFNSPVQPSLGLGVMATELNGDFDYEFSASIGLAGNFGPLLVLGGYDVTSGGIDLGVAYNFKANKSQRKK